MSSNAPITDSIVTYQDAKAWYTELCQRSSGQLTAHLMELEPAVLGIAMHFSAHLRLHLARNGVPSTLASTVGDEVLRAAAICCELTRRGYAEFMRDFLEPQSTDSNDREE